MMANRIHFLFVTPLLICCILLGGCDTRNNVEPRFESYFTKYYGGEGDQYGKDLIAHDDGTFFLLGNSNLPTGITNPFLMRVDQLGNVMWETHFGAGEVAVDLEIIKRGVYEGSFVVVSNVGPQDRSKIRLWRINSSGVLLDSITLVTPPVSGLQVATSVTSLEHEDGFVITGYADGSLINESSPEVEGPSDRDILVFRIDDAFSTVETVVSKGGELNGAGVRVFEMSSSLPGRLLLFSYTDRPNMSNAFEYNFSYDVITAGVPIGKLVGSENDREILNAVMKIPATSGEGFLMAGTATPNGGGPGSIYLVRVNGSAEYKGLDIKIPLGLNVECVSVAGAPGGYYVLANHLVDAAIKNVLLINVSLTGEVLWIRNFGANDGESTASAVAALPDGRIALVATMQLKTRKKMALIVLSNNGAF